MSPAHAMIVATSVLSMFIAPALAAAPDTRPARTPSTQPLGVTVIKTEGQGLTPPVFLPDGQEFKIWRPATKWTRTYHVACRNPQASDDNPGTLEKPFRTISKAAAILEPGQRVIIHNGIYRERVRPARGGTGPEAMIGYETAEGETVDLRGSREFKEPWTKVEGEPAIWEAALTEKYFDVPGENPFREPNITNKQFDIMDWAEPKRGKKPYTLSRGLVFQNGLRLAQVHERADLAKAAGTYWVGGDGGQLFVRPLKGANPNKAMMEITVQGMIFAPDKENLGWIVVRGLTIEHAGNQFPMPQQGALSTMRGHHWLIERTGIHNANGCGMDIGIQAGRTDLTVGYHIVRDNFVTDCGVCGIAGIRPDGSLIEGNFLINNAFHDVETYYETGSIKTHTNRSVVIRGNQILGTLHGPGIWMDWQNVNSRCTGNILYDTHTIHGAIFIEGSTQPNLIDSNFIYAAQRAGIYEHDCRGQTFAHNFIMNGAGAGILLRGIVTPRLVHGQKIAGGGHFVYNNVLAGNAKSIELHGPPTRTEGNLSEGVEAKLDPDPAKMVLTWKVTTPPPPCKPVMFGDVAIITHDFFGKPMPKEGLYPGPFGPPADTPVNLETK